MFLRVIIVLYAGGVWAPAYAPLLPWTGLPLQIMDILLPLVIILLWRRTMTLSPIAWVIFALLWVSSAIHTPPLGTDRLIWIWQMSLPMVHVFAHAIIFSDTRLTNIWIKGFSAGAAMSLFIASGQIISGGHWGDWRNNIAFSLPPQAHRGVGLMPEVSTFAALISICVALHFVSRADRHTWPSWVLTDRKSTL